MSEKQKKIGEITICFNPFTGDLLKLMNKIKDLVVWNEDIECDLSNIDFDWNEEDFVEEDE